MELDKTLFKNEGVHEIATVILKHRELFAERNKSQIAKAYLLNLAQTFPEDSRPIIELLTTTKSTHVQEKPKIQMKEVDPKPKGKVEMVAVHDPDCLNCPPKMVEKFSDPSQFDDDHITNVSKELSNEMDAHNKKAGNEAGTLNPKEVDKDEELQLTKPVLSETLIEQIKEIGENFEAIAALFDNDLQKISIYGKTINFKPKYNVSKAETYAKHLYQYIMETYAS